jgi:hypothetical protein
MTYNTSLFANIDRLLTNKYIIFFEFVDKNIFLPILLKYKLHEEI